MWHYRSVPQGNKGRGNIIGNSPKVILCQAAGKHECLNNFPAVPHLRITWFLPGSQHTSGIGMEGGRKVVIGLSSWFSLTIYLYFLIQWRSFLVAESLYNGNLQATRMYSNMMSSAWPFQKRKSKIQAVLPWISPSMQPRTKIAQVHQCFHPELIQHTSPLLSPHLPSQPLSFVLYISITLNTINVFIVGKYPSLSIVLSNMRCPRNKQIFFLTLQNEIFAQKQSQSKRKTTYFALPLYFETKVEPGLVPALNPDQLKSLWSQ